ncbi:Uncharacterised protein [Mycobacterium tuberculosis]|nr:Uncharacterised protein [Mycobacterium tuberculosis]
MADAGGTAITAHATHTQQQPGATAIAACATHRGDVGRHHGRGASAYTTAATTHATRAKQLGDAPRTAETAGAGKAHRRASTTVTSR